MKKKYRWNAKKCASNMAVLLTVLGVNVVVFWLLVNWISLGGAA